MVQLATLNVLLPNNRYAHQHFTIKQQLESLYKTRVSMRQSARARTELARPITRASSYTALSSANLSARGTSMN